MSSGAPDWLTELELRFGAALRTPLVRMEGTLRADSTGYDPALVHAIVDGPRVSARSGLAVYNRQYWFRLFDVLQQAYPLTTAVLGASRFNEYAARFLRASPPRSFDVADAAEGFARFLEDELGPLDADAPSLELEAARVDDAHYEVTRAPPTTPYRPSAADVEALIDARLVLRRELALIVEHWPLVELRRSLVTPLVLPPPLAAPRASALLADARGVHLVPLEAREAELLSLVSQLPLGEALAVLEARASDRERDELPERVRGWLARAVALGFFAGVER